jgi:hypothetical protein
VSFESCWIRQTFAGAKARDKNAKILTMKSANQGHWEFRSVQDVSHFWEDHRFVPGRADGRKKHQEERHYLGLYLLALSGNQSLSYPFRIDQGKEHESPDFMFSWNSGETTGLEVTRATRQEFQRDLTLAEREYQKKHAKAIASGEAPEDILPLVGWSDDLVDDLASGEAPKFLPPPGWAGDEPENELCSLVRRAIEKKLTKLRGEPPKFESKFKPAARQDLLVYEQAPIPAGADRGKVLAGLRPYVRASQAQKPSFEKISIVVALDVIFDLGGDCRFLPYIEWSALKPGDRDSLMKLAKRVEEAGQIAVEEAIREHAAMGRDVHFMDGRGRMIKQTPDGRRFEVRLLDDGEEVVVKEL